MRKSPIIETLYEVSIVFRKESFINANKVSNFIQSLTNEKKVINSNGVPYAYVKPICFKQIKRMDDDEQSLRIFRSFYFEIKCNSNKKDSFEFFFQKFFLPLKYA